MVALVAAAMGLLAAFGVEITPAQQESVIIFVGSLITAGIALGVAELIKSIINPMNTKKKSE